MRIKITINSEHVVYANLDSTPTAIDFYSALPLTLNLRDFAGTEKASSKLPKNLATPALPYGHKPTAGELAYYAPWGNLAIFYKPDSYADGLVRLGKAEGDPTVFNSTPDIEIQVEKAQ